MQQEFHIRITESRGPLPVPWNRVLLEELEGAGATGNGLTRFLRRLRDFLAFWRRRRGRPVTEGLVRLLAPEESESRKVPATFDRRRRDVTLIEGSALEGRVEVTCELTLGAGGLSGRILLQARDGKSPEDTEAYVEEDDD